MSLIEKSNCVPPSCLVGGHSLTILPALTRWVAHVTVVGGRILRRISDGPHRGILAKYAGCYNPRPMRGGNRPSKHSWGAAIDMDPDHNGLKTSWPVAASMPIEVMEEFAREGWIGLGWQIGRDSMHFQPTR
jgi:hypothetical protein